MNGYTQAGAGGTKNIVVLDKIKSNGFPLVGARQIELDADKCICQLCLSLEVH